MDACELGHASTVQVLVNAKANLNLQSPVSKPDRCEECSLRCCFLRINRRVIYVVRCVVV
jgi:hypothetical protein